MDREEGDRQAREAPLLDIDPELNIFALANGLDLYRNHRGGVDRVLEWYRDGMERRICIVADGDPSDDGSPAYTVFAEATRKREGVRASGRRDLERAAPFDQIRGRLRALLADGIDRANELGERDLTVDS